MFVTDEMARNALPPTGFLRRYTDYASQCTDAPLIFHITTGLAIMSVLCPTSACTASFGGDTHGNLFGILVGPSGSRKTTALDLGLDLLRKNHGQLIAQQPGSYEGLVDILNDKPRVLIPEPEMSRFFRQAKGDSFLGALKYGYNEAYDGKGLSRRTRQVNLQGRDDLRLSLLGAIATDNLENEIDSTDLTGGFMSRFIIGIGESRERTLYRPQELTREKEALIEDVAHLENCSFNARIVLNEAAQDAHAAFIAKTDPLLTGRTHKRVAGFFERAGALARKLTLLLALDKHASTHPRGTSWYNPEHLDRFSQDGTIVADADTFLQASKLSEMYLQSEADFAMELATTYAGRARKRVLSSVPDSIVGVPLGTITLRSEMDNNTALRWIKTLLEQGVIETLGWPDGATTYVRRKSAPGEDPAMTLMFPDGIPEERPPKLVALEPDALPQGPQTPDRGGPGVVPLPAPPPPEPVSQEESILSATRGPLQIPNTFPD